MDKLLWVQPLHSFTNQEDKWGRSAAFGSRALAKPHVHTLWGKTKAENMSWS